MICESVILPDETLWLENMENLLLPLETEEACWGEGLLGRRTRAQSRATQETARVRAKQMARDAARHGAMPRTNQWGPWTNVRVPDAH